jgi:hypothetical protein
VTSDIRNVTFDCADPWAISEFWAAVTGYSRWPDDKPGDDEVALNPPAGAGPKLLFIRVPEGKVVKNRVHVDLAPDTTRDEEVARLVGLGATVVDNQVTPDGKGWVVMADPEGNEFCVERSAAERASS